MLDYKKMYQIMVTETENAINTLIAAQRRCEEMFLEGKDAELILMDPSAETKDMRRLS